MLTFIITFFIALFIGCWIFLPDSKTPTPRRRRRRPTEPHGLPWMDPNYQKRKDRARNSNKF